MEAKIVIDCFVIAIFLFILFVSLIISNVGGKKDILVASVFTLVSLIALSLSVKGVIGKVRYIKSDEYQKEQLQRKVDYYNSKLKKFIEEHPEMKEEKK